MLASSGDKMPPCGVPVSVSSLFSEFSHDPDLRNAFTKASTRLSPTR